LKPRIEKRTTPLPRERVRLKVGLEMKQKQRLLNPDFIAGMKRCRND
jgi:hypothetical protein